MTISKFSFEVDSNANTVDTAVLSVRLSNVNTTMVIVIDQATGFFIDEDFCEVCIIISSGFMKESHAWSIFFVYPYSIIDKELEYFGIVF